MNAPRTDSHDDDLNEMRRRLDVIASLEMAYCPACGPEYASAPSLPTGTCHVHQSDGHGLVMECGQCTLRFTVTLRSLAGGLRHRIEASGAEDMKDIYSGYLEVVDWLVSAQRHGEAEEGGEP